MRWLPILLATGLAACSPAENSEPAVPSAPEPRPFAPNDGIPRVPLPEAVPGRVLTDIDGNAHGSLEDPGHTKTLFFVRSDCPISNQYAPEIRRICADYGPDGVECLLVYIERNITPEDVRAHLEEFGHTLPAILDTDHQWVAQAGATVTPEAAVFTDRGELAYRGRIDNLYETLGRPRRRVTETELRDALDDLARGVPVRTPRTQATGCYIE